MSTHRTRIGVLAALAILAAVPSPSRSQTPPPIDVSALLECRADMASYLDFRRWISRGGAAVAKAGFAWRKTDLFQAAYRLSRPATAFGMQVQTLGLTNDGVLAEVGGTTPQRLAKRLGVDVLLDTGSMFVANKLVSANDAAKAHAGETLVVPSDLDALLGTKPSQPAFDAQEIVRVVTNQGRPGKTMVGCNYVSSAASPGLPFPQP